MTQPTYPSKLEENIENLIKELKEINIKQKNVLTSLKESSDLTRVQNKIIFTLTLAFIFVTIGIGNWFRITNLCDLGICIPCCKDITLNKISMILGVSILIGSVCSYLKKEKLELKEIVPWVLIFILVFVLYYCLLLIRG